MSGRLDGKVAVVVGGGTGFGLATVRRFAEEGASLLVAGRRLDVVEEVAAANGGSATRCDVTDDDSVQALSRVDRREPLIAKPFSFRQLSRTIRETLDDDGQVPAG